MHKKHTRSLTRARYYTDTDLGDGFPPGVERREWPPVFVTEGTGPLHTSLRSSAVVLPIPASYRGGGDDEDGGSLRKEIGQVAPSLTAPIVHKWIEDDGTAQTSPFMHLAMSLYSSDAVVDKKPSVAFWCVKRGPDGQLTCGVPIECMIAETCDWELWPWPVMSPELTLHTSRTVRNTLPPPPLVLPQVATPEPPVIQAIRRLGQGRGRRVSTGQLGFWMRGPPLWQPEVAAKLLEEVSAVLERGLARGVRVDRWQFSEHLGDAYRFTFLV